MSTPTPSNTLPAIRALLWERWRQTRWACLVMWGVYGLFYFVYWRDREYRPAPNYGVIEGIHLFGLPMLIMLAIVGMNAYSGDGRSFSFRMPASMLRLPLSTPRLAAVQLVVQGIGVLLFVGGMLVIDYLLFRHDALVFRQPMAHLLLALLTFATLIHAWLTLFPQTLSAALALPAVGWVAGFVPRWDPGLRTLPELSVALVVAGGLSVAALYLARSQSIPRGNHLAAAVNAIPRAGSSRFRGPLRALIWLEWRSWGWMLVAAMVLVGLSSKLPDFRRFGFDAINNPTTAWLILYIVAFVMGCYLPLREMGKTGTQPSTFSALRPMTTAQLAFGRLAGRASIVAASILAILLAEASAGMLPLMAFRLIMLAPIFLGIWVLMNAFWPSVLVMLFSWPVLTWISAMELMVTGTAPRGLLFPSMVLESALALIAIVWIALGLARRDAMRLDTTLRVLAGSAVVMFLGAAAYGWLLPEAFSPSDIASAGLIGTVAVAGPIVWQVYWVDRRRHGGPQSWR